MKNAIFPRGREGKRKEKIDKSLKNRSLNNRKKYRKKNEFVFQFREHLFNAPFTERKGGGECWVGGGMKKEKKKCE